MVHRRLVLLVIVILFGGIPSGNLRADQAKQPKEDDYYELHKLLVDTLDQVERNYVKDISRRELIEAAIKGVLNELDPYSAYIAPDDLDQFRTAVDGNFGGIGIRFAVDHGRLKVLSPLVGTPAYRAGIMAGDLIAEINGKSTKGIKVEGVARQLKGKEGSEVTLGVIHAGKSDMETITITREIVRVDTVLGNRRKEDDHWDYMLDADRRIGYVRVEAFSRETARDLRAAIDQLEEESLRGLILDLRFNPGGLLSSAIEVSDLFVADGRIVSTEGKKPDRSERVWEAHKKGTLEEFAMVVLVNRYTASAAEIVSACLQDHNRAVVMGERTWGKGSVQNVIPLEGGRSALKLTTASYLRPSGKNIHRFPGVDEDEEWGVMPNDGYQLKLGNEEMVRLLHDRQQREVVRPKHPEPAETDQSSGSPQGTEEPEGTVDAPREEEKPAETAEPEATSPLEASKFVDPHLRMAIDYLTAELARAD
ncbi:MAG: S41 family peptidase [Planctomycetes bacterium]|nr:S41 family peptidase [Planctomycetota bacterium]